MRVSVVQMNAAPDKGENIEQAKTLIERRSPPTARHRQPAGSVGLPRRRPRAAIRQRRGPAAARLQRHRRPGL